MYINIDYEQLFEMLRWLDATDNRKNPWKRFAPANSDIDKLFKDYECVEFLENFYDSEPDYDDEEYNMFLDYCSANKTKDSMAGCALYRILINEGECFSKKPHSPFDYKMAWVHVRKQQKEYEKKRIVFCNWTEPHMEGNWGATQESVDDLAKSMMYQIKKSPIHKRDRFWIHTEPNNQICIYYYGRDYLECDYVWLMQKREG